MVFVDENIPSKYHDAAFTIMADCIHHAGIMTPYVRTEGWNARANKLL